MKKISFFFLFILITVNLLSQNKDIVFADTSKGIMILVNKTHRLLKSFVPDNLVKMEDKYGDANKMIREEAYKAFISMHFAAKMDSVTLWITSAYRTYDYQSWLYNKSVKEKGVAYADKSLAKPGFSEHQTGLAIDLVESKGYTFKDFEKKKQYEWLSIHAHEYGFILRYPEGKENITGYGFEPWHYRYVGVVPAKMMKRLNLTFEEYYEMFVNNRP
jgi:D-alanyl-D-alanine carboxypeptidase